MPQRPHKHSSQFQWQGSLHASVNRPKAAHLLFKVVYRAGPRHVGAPEKSSDLLNRSLLNLLELGHGSRDFFKANTQISAILEEFCFAYGNLSLLAPYFRLFQWSFSLSAPGSCSASPTHTPALTAGSVPVMLQEPHKISCLCLWKMKFTNNSLTTLS